MAIPEELLIAIHKFMTICCVQPGKKIKKYKKNVSVAGEIPEKKKKKNEDGLSLDVCEDAEKVTV